MNCQKCELLLGLDERSSELDRHLDACESCRALAADLRANAEILQEMASDPMPAVRHAVLARISERKKGTDYSVPGRWLSIPPIPPGVDRAVCPLFSRPRSRTLRWGWALAAAAILVIAIIAPRFREQNLPPVHYALLPMKFDIPPIAPAPPRTAPAKPLMVKILTDDPNVVIYWEVDSEGDNQ